MSQSNPLLSILLSAGLAAATAAQAQLNAEAPALVVGTWLQGEPATLGGDTAAKATVVAFYSRGAQASSWTTDAAYLAHLQQRLGEHGLAVVALVASEAADRTLWAGVRIATDPEGAAAAAWCYDGQPSPHVFVVDSERRVTFFGTPDAGLVDAIDQTLAGRFDPTAAGRASQVRSELVSGFDDATAPMALEQLAIAAAFPRDGLLLGLEYLVRATKANDAAAAAKVLDRALGALAGESRPLATFADLALRGDARRPGLVGKLRPVVQAAAAASPNDVALQLALLRCLVLAGDGREVGRCAARMRKLTQASAEHSLDLACILILDENAPVHRDLATMAVDRAEVLGIEPRYLTAARYGIAVRCANDAAAQKRLVDAFLADEINQGSLNNICWYLMTELPTMGRFDPFVVCLAERMLENRESMGGHEFDTAALAMFLVGRVDEAIALQETALRQGGAGNPEYEERLSRYRAAQASAPR